jgi:hypothetical protein
MFSIFHLVDEGDTKDDNVITIEIGSRRSSRLPSSTDVLKKVSDVNIFLDSDVHEEILLPDAFPFSHGKYIVRNCT